VSNLDKKVEELKQFIANKGKNGVIIAFSGGVDSTTLAALCYEVLGSKAVAVTATSPTYTSEELEEAKQTANQIGIKLHLVESDELSNQNFTNNPENRCYFCKKELLSQMEKMAKKLGFEAVFEGTNFSDLSGHRPGFVAVQESESVYSPWVTNKFSRQEIRLVAKGLGLSVFDKPSNACLASRIPFNEQITAEKLDRIAKAEQIIRKLTGVTQLRVRDHNSLARIEVPKNNIKLFGDKEVITIISEELKNLGFKFVTVDLEGYRTGSMLKTLDK